jgi:hypothetical protein
VEIDGRAEMRSWIQRAVVRVLMVSWALGWVAVEDEERAMMEHVRKRMSSRISAAALLMPSVELMSMKRMLDWRSGDSRAMG